MNTENPKIGFVLKKIVTEQFAIIKDAFHEGNQIQLNTQSQFAVDASQKIIVVKTVFKFDQTLAPFLLIEASCHFRITDDTWSQFILPEQNVLKVPAAFLAHLTMLTVGTVRGILHAKTENTPFNNFLIPTINVAALIKEDISFDLKNQQ